VNATTDEQRLRYWHSVLAAYDGLPIPDQNSLVYVAVPIQSIKFNREENQIVVLPILAITW
jgi:hypothetical protein